MSHEIFNCPVCEHVVRRPGHTLFPRVHDTPWVDTCSCCDDSMCFAHRYSDEHLPERPPEEVMEARSRTKHAEAVAEWKVYKARVLARIAQWDAIMKKGES